MNIEPRRRLEGKASSSRGILRLDKIGEGLDGLKEEEKGVKGLGKEEKNETRADLARHEEVMRKLAVVTGRDRADRTLSPGGYVTPGRLRLSALLQIR